MITHSKNLKRISSNMSLSLKCKKFTLLCFSSDTDILQLIYAIGGDPIFKIYDITFVAIILIIIRILCVLCFPIKHCGFTTMHIRDCLCVSVKCKEYCVRLSIWISVSFKCYTVFFDFCMILTNYQSLI